MNNTEKIDVLKKWVDEEYDGGRVTAITDEEMVKAINEACDQLGLPRP